MNRAEKCFTVVCVVLFFGFIYLFLGAVDKLDQYNTYGIVISIERLNEQIVRFETEDGNLWEYTFDLDEPIDIGDKARLTFKEYENDNIYDDSIVRVVWTKGE